MISFNILNNMNALKYLSNKKGCPLCHNPLNRDNKEIYCSNCGFVWLDYEPNTREQLDFIFELIHT